MLGSTLSSVLPLLFAPLVAARLIADRSKTSIAITVCWAMGLIAQWSVQLRGMSNRDVHEWTNPFWVLPYYVTRVVPRALFGERALGGPGTNGDGHTLPLVIPNVAIHIALIWGAWAIVVAAVIIALARLTAPDWALAVTALLFSVLLFVGEIVNNLPIVQPRYVIAPVLPRVRGPRRGACCGRAAQRAGPGRPTRRTARRPRGYARAHPCAPAALGSVDPGRGVRPRAGGDLRVQLPRDERSFRKPAMDRGRGGGDKNLHEPRQR